MADSPLFALSYKPYVLHLKTPVKMARGMFSERRGAILKLEHDGRSAFSELLPLPHFGTETLEEALEFLAGLPPIADVAGPAVPPDLPATKFAVEAAMLELSGDDGCGEYVREQMPVSKLLPSDSRFRELLEDGLREGYSIFKIKIGLQRFESELAMVQEAAAKLPSGAKLRIDANEGLTTEQARRWLGSLEDLPIEFLEQPLKREFVDETIRLTEEFPTAIALDESIATSQDMIDCYKKGFRGVFASKPLRLGELRKFLAWREETAAKISYSTIFETAVGSLFGIKLAASDRRNAFGLGFGVSHWFKETGLALPSQPKYSRHDLLSLDRAAIWERLG